MFAFKLRAELRYIGVWGLTFLLSSCSFLPQKEKTKTATVDRHWIDLVAAKVRMGAGIGPDDNIEELEKLSKPEIVDRLMDDPRFVETVFDFSLYFLGFKSDGKGHAKGDINSIFFGSLGDVSPAITAAQEYARQGDFLKLFDYIHPFYAFPLLKADYQFDATGNLTLKDIDRPVEKAAFLEKLNHLIKLIDDDPAMPKSKFCKYVDDSDVSSYESNRLMSPYDFDASPGFNMYNKICRSRPKDLPLTAAEIEVVHNVPVIYKKFFDYIEQFAWPNYQIASVMDYQLFDVNQLATTFDPLRRTNSWLWKGLPNSSTNKNRKRASYILKRYFCDDLTPLNVEQSKVHAADRHASDPACQSCHYKLDPIAGFFKNHGAQGYKFMDLESELYFDDGANAPLKNYVSEWRDRETGDWNIGYVRSTTDKSLNTYAPLNPADPQMEDLFAIIKAAPEVRQCLMKRASEYVLGSQFTMDGSYMRYLSDHFTKQAEHNSSAALREAFKDLLLSNTFATDTAEPGVCYDFAPGVDASHRPPCEIADIIERNCASCHGATSASGGLNLTVWAKNPSGFGFEHLDENGAPRPPELSFTSIMNRLNDPNPDARMPLGSYMSTQDRQKFYLWISASLQLFGKSKDTK